MKSIKSASLLLAMAAMSTHHHHPLLVASKKKTNSSKMPLSDEELKTLATLSGKEKKRFVKELREKYKYQMGSKS